MASTNVVARSVNELSLAAWFGGSLFGAVASARAGVNDMTDDRDLPVVAWGAWRPVEATAVAAQLLSGTVLTIANRRRVLMQAGVGVSTVGRMVLTAAATAATLQVWRSAARASSEWEPAEGTQNGRPSGPSAALRWSVPALTGAMLVLDAWMGEQQRPATVLGGLARKFRR